MPMNSRMDKQIVAYLHKNRTSLIAVIAVTSHWVEVIEIPRLKWSLNNKPNNT